jgi:hypothetical protein
MATTLHRDDTETVTRPSWPQHVREDGVVDLRDDTSLPYASDERDDRREPVRRRGLRARRTIGWIVAAAVLAAVAVVATLNRTGEVGIDFAFDDGALPLWSIIAGACALGFAAGRFLDDGC